jgi:hypothetical protein
MKPSVDEQLHQSRRILLEEVLPAIESDHVADIVRRLAADLRKLGTCWEMAAPFSRWEVETLESVLDGVGSALAEPDREELTGLRGVSLAEDARYGEWCERAETLRRALDFAVRRLPPPAEAPAAWTAVRAYFGERLERDPMTNRQPHA